jgi:formylglycine-generating enzyme required for sulfatase activity
VRAGLEACPALLLAVLAACQGPAPAPLAADTESQTAAERSAPEQPAPAAASDSAVRGEQRRPTSALEPAPAHSQPNGGAPQAQPPGPAPRAPAEGPPAEPFTLRIPGTRLALEFLPLPAPNGGHLWLSSVEVPWEAYDVFLFGFDLPPEQRVRGWDAASRPSRPYGAPDRGLGHQGYAAQAMTAEAAESFARWLSERCGVCLRLPTESEWEWAARGAAARPAGVADDLAPARRIPSELGQQVGFAPYEGPRPAALASLPAGPFGHRGLTGNLLEWVRAEAGGHTTAGGCFLDPPELLRPERREPQAPSWNETDPQNPKSRWWLANAPFVGFRLLAEAPPAAAPRSGP